MSPEQAQDAAIDTVGKVVVVLGGPEGWSHPGRSAPQGCTEDPPYDHVDYSYARRIAPGIIDRSERRALGEKVREYLESLGMTIMYVTDKDPDLMNVVAAGGDVDSIDVAISKEFITVRAHSLCVPGDWSKLMDEYVATSPPEPPRYRVVTDPPTPPPNPTP